MRKLINLDTAAGTDNPSSIHASGVRAARELEHARAKVALSLVAHADEIIFTSGGTEANNLAIFGLVRPRVPPGHSGSVPHIITTVIEHVSILEPCRQLEREGFPVTYLPVNPDGLISLKELTKTLRPDTVLVSIGYANNEIGTIQPIREIARVIRNFKKSVQHSVSGILDTECFFHTDACQAPRFLDCRVSTLGVDLMTLNSGKIYGPRGAGCLYVRRGIDLQPILSGGGQERGRRSGTENVPAITGFAQALEQCLKWRAKESARLTKLRDYFIGKLLTLPDVILNGSTTARLPNNVNVSFARADSEFMVLNLDAHGVLAASGSACSAHEKSSSHVIGALSGQADSAVRFTLGRDTKKSDLDYVLKILPNILARARVD